MFSEVDCRKCCLALEFLRRKLARSKLQKLCADVCVDGSGRKRFKGSHRLLKASSAYPRGFGNEASVGTLLLALNHASILNG